MHTVGAEAATRALHISLSHQAQTLPGVQIPGASIEGPGECASTEFPPMAAADAQRYRQVFQQMDADKDSYVLVSRVARMTELS